MKTQDIVKAASKKDGLSLKKLVHEVLATKVVAALDAERRVVAAQYFGEDVESLDEGSFRLIHKKSGNTVATGSKKFVTDHHKSLTNKHEYELHTLVAKHKNQVSKSGKSLPEF